MKPVFISYRRQGGGVLARSIYGSLLRRGYSAFLDVDDLRAGPFNTALLEQIASASDFLLILTPGSLERCAHEGDWMRREVEHALGCGVNIVPILADGFRWPEEKLPEPIEGLRMYQGAILVLELFEESIDKLTRYLRAVPHSPGAALSHEPVRAAASVEQLDAWFVQAMTHRDALEGVESSRLMKKILQHDPDYRHPGWDLTAAFMLSFPRPDRRNTILLVVGHEIEPQLHDGPQALWLREQIDSRGDREEMQFAGLVTDRGLLDAVVFQDCPAIAIGGPATNAFTRELLRTGLPADQISLPNVQVQYRLEPAPARAALWGKTAKDTSEAVRTFVKRNLLDRFLNAVWKK